MGIPESCGSSVKNGDFKALAPGILIQNVEPGNLYFYKLGLETNP